MNEIDKTFEIKRQLQALVDKYGFAKIQEVLMTINSKEGDL